MELSKITNFALLHNHMTIELLLKFFDFGSKPFVKLDELFRKELILALKGTDRPGMILSFVWEVSMHKEKEYVDNLWKSYTDNISNVCFVELTCPQKIRLERNKGTLRIKEKPSKADLTWSDNNLLEMDNNFVMNSSEKHLFPYPERHLNIDNSSLAPEVVAEKIILDCRVYH